MVKGFPGWTPGGVSSRKMIRRWGIWFTIWISWIVIFGVFAPQVQGVTLWNFLLTFGGALDYTSVVVGIWVTLLFIGCVDIILAT